MWDLLDHLLDVNPLELRDRAWELWRKNQAHEKTRQDILDWLRKIEPEVINGDALGIIYGVKEQFGA